jgi:two-component system response regulator MprA
VNSDASQNEAASVPAEGPARTVPSDRKGRVLVVDDDASVRESLGRALRSENYEVALAGDGQEALSRFNEGYVDLVLLDLNIPITGGWDVFERISALNPLLPIIIITARSQQYELAATAGATALMEKPLSLPLLLDTITGLINEPVGKRLQRIVTHQPILLAPGS